MRRRPTAGRVARLVGQRRAHLIALGEREIDQAAAAMGLQAIDPARAAALESLSLNDIHVLASREATVADLTHLSRPVLIALLEPDALTARQRRHVLALQPATC